MSLSFQSRLCCRRDSLVSSKTQIFIGEALVLSCWKLFDFAYIGWKCTETSIWSEFSGEYGSVHAHSEGGVPIPGHIPLYPKGGLLQGSCGAWGIPEVWWVKMKSLFFAAFLFLFFCFGRGPQCRVWKQKTIFLELSSDTPHVTATVAALGVSSHGLWRNVLMRLWVLVAESTSTSLNAETSFISNLKYESIPLSVQKISAIV